MLFSFLGIDQHLVKVTLDGADEVLHGRIFVSHVRVQADVVKRGPAFMGLFGDRRQVSHDSV